MSNTQKIALTGGVFYSKRHTVCFMRIGPYQLPNNLFVAPMAGVTDRPFRQLCKTLGAGYAVSEMAASNPQLWKTDKSTRRLNHEGEIAPIAVQIAGSDPAMLAHAAQFNVDKGAQIIDINMGCPAKKVCNVAAGSALLRDESLVASIVSAVVRAVDVPVSVDFERGYGAMFSEHILQANEGCDMDFLLTQRGERSGEPDIN